MNDVRLVLTVAGLCLTAAAHPVNASLVQSCNSTVVSDTTAVPDTVIAFAIGYSRGEVIPVGAGTSLTSFTVFALEKTGYVELALQIVPADSLGVPDLRTILATIGPTAYPGDSVAPHRVVFTVDPPFVFPRYGNYGFFIRTCPSPAGAAFAASTKDPFQAGRDLRKHLTHAPESRVGDRLTFHHESAMQRVHCRRDPVDAGGVLFPVRLREHQVVVCPLRIQAACVPA